MSVPVPMMTGEQYDNLMDLRSLLFGAIKHSLDECGHCKSYEGTFEVSQIWCFPNYFEPAAAPVLMWKIELHCYVIGPSRHYEWLGASFGESFAKAEKCVRAWVKDEMEGTESDIPQEEWS